MCLFIAGARRKIVASRHCEAGPLGANRRLSRRPWAAALFRNRSTAVRPHATAVPCTPLPDRLCRSHEADDVPWIELDPDRGPKRIDAEQPQIVIEIAEL